MLKKNYHNMLSRKVTDRQTDIQSCYINIARQCAKAR